MVFFSVAATLFVCNMWLANSTYLGPRYYLIDLSQDLIHKKQLLKILWSDGWDFNWYRCFGSRSQDFFLLLSKLALAVLCLNTWTYESPFHNMCLWGQSLYAAYWTHGVAIFQDNRCCPTRLVSEMISVFSEKKIGINDAYKKSSLHT